LTRYNYIRVKRRNGKFRLVKKKRGKSLSSWAHDQAHGRKRVHEPDPEEKPLSVGTTEDFFEGYDEA
jgi:hypothetical protein